MTEYLAQRLIDLRPFGLVQAMYKMGVDVGLALNEAKNPALLDGRLGLAEIESAEKKCCPGSKVKKDCIVTGDGRGKAEKVGREKVA